MSRKSLFVRVGLAGAGVVAAACCIAFTQPEKPTGQPEMPLPPGWTAEDMQACMEAGMPGEMHAFLASTAGTWQGQCSMWMYEGAPPMNSTCTATIAPIMDGHYTRCELSGESPEMGPFQGEGTYGFDNVSQKFVASWIDSHSSGIWNGTGELSADKKTLTWTYTYMDPINKKAATMREIERFTSPTKKTLESYMKDPKSGKEYKMMTIEFTKL